MFSHFRFGQFRILNLRILLTNIYYDCFFNWQTEKKNLFWTNKKFVFFFNCSNWEKIVEKIRETNWWNYLMDSLKVEIDEEDSSVTRPEELVKKLFHRAGLKIITELKQQKMPKGLYPVKMFVLQSNSWIKPLAQKKVPQKILSNSISTSISMECFRG